MGLSKKLPLVVASIFLLGGLLLSLGCTGNNPPLVPSNPWPSDGASGQPRSLTLSWSGGDPDPELPYYDVYLGTTTPPPLKEVNLIEKYCEISDLDSNTTYYWMIVAQDEQGDTAAGPIWSFSTTMGDSYEPNDFFSAAYGPLEFGAVYESWIWNLEDYYDFYYFIPDDSGRVKIDLYSLPADYDLVLFDANQEELDWSSNYGITDESISCFVTESDIYYVVVFQCAPADSTDSYLLKVDYDTAQAKDSYEPNDFFDEAYGPLDFETTYESWISTPDDEDFYYFVPASDGWIWIDLYDLPEDYDLYLCDSNYDLIDASENEYTESEWIEFEGSASETYYVVVVPFEGYDAVDSYYLEIYYSEALQSWGLMSGEKKLRID
ncbi:PPC domain-containing protein [candidate division WOR-3 bacterium]|nr:PPC domain-containing protein [candidate division WOR-3 bacterium]